MPNTADHPLWHRDLSVVTEEGVKRAALLKKEPRLTLSSLLTSKKVYGITSPALLLTSCKCRIQYIGETKRRLSDRFGEHRRAVEKAITQRDIDQPTAVSDHFTLPGHSLNNLELI